MLQHDLELRKILTQWQKLGLNEHRLPVKKINLRVGHLTVHQQRQASPLHGSQHRVNLADVGHSGVAVGGGAGRVELERHNTGLGRQGNFRHRQVVC